MGKGGRTKQEANQTNYDNDVVAGEGAIALGENSAFSTNENSGVQIDVGDNSSYSVTAMDDNTAKMMQTALAVVSNNSNNMMQVAAQVQRSKTELEHRLPATNTETRLKTLDGKTVSIFGGFVLLIALIVAVALRKRKGGK